MYFLKLALRPWRESLATQLLIVTSSGFLIALSLGLLWVGKALTPVIADLKSQGVLTAYLNAEVSELDLPTVVAAVENVSRTKNRPDPRVELFRRSDFIEQLAKREPELGQQLRGLGDEARRIVPRFISVKGLITDRAVVGVKQVAGIEKVETSRDVYVDSASAFETLQNIVRLIFYGLALTLLSTLVHMGRSHQRIFSSTEAMMRLWGARSWQVRLPSMAAGASTVLLGGALASLLWVSWVDRLAPQLQKLFPVAVALPLLEVNVVWMILVGSLLVGSTSGLFRGTRARA